MITGIFLYPSIDSGTQSTASAKAYAPQTDRNFITISSQNLSNANIDALADNFGIVHFEKENDNWSITAHFGDARRLVARNPKVAVYEYFSASYWFTNNQWDRWGAQFNQDWYLKDSFGRAIKAPTLNPNATGNAYYLDLANPALRAWAVQTIVDWMGQAPYAGIKFDSAMPIGLYGSDVDKWDSLIGPSRVKAWNAGLTDLLSTTTVRLAQLGKKVVYNGIAPSTLKGPDRNLSLLAVTNGAMDEAFCLNFGYRNPAQQRPVALTDDLQTMRQYDQKLLMFHTTYGIEANEHYAPYCLGAFLMGWVPGSTYYRVGIDYSTDQLSSIYPETNLALGDPIGNYEQDGDVLSRQFANGFVVVNSGATPAQSTAPAAAVRYTDGKSADHVTAGGTLSLAGYESQFFLDDSYLDGPGSGRTGHSQGPAAGSSSPEPRQDAQPGAIAVLPRRSG